MGNTGFRLYGLEALRGFAATYLFLDHLVLSIFPSGGPALVFFKFGGEAVILFFVLSGFTVTYSTLSSENTSFRLYLFKRFSRIYPIFLLTLFISFLLVVPFMTRIADLLGNIFMLQEYSQSRYGVIAETYGNPALWSLSYEWWFYLQFWLFFRFVPARFQTFLVSITGCAALVAYYVFRFQPFLFVGLLPIWWMGAVFAKQYMDGGRMPSAVTLLLILLPFSVCIMQAMIIGDISAGAISHSPLLEARQFLVAIIMSGLAMIAGWRRIELLGKLTLLSRFLAKNSYAIYALHFPIIIVVLDIVTHPMLRLIISIALVLTVSWAAETYFQPMATKMLKQIFGLNRRAGSARAAS